MTTLTVHVRGTPVTFQTPYTDAQAVALLPDVKSPFAQDLAARIAAGKNLSPIQWAWVHKLVVDAHNRPAPQSLEMNLLPIVELLEKAHGHLKNPAITLELNGTPLELKRAGERSKYPGQVYVTDGGGYGNSRYYGRIGLDGSVTAGRDLSTEITEVLTDFAKDPVRMAQEHGRKTGRCCFCNRPLKDERSTVVGYGPICADHFDLPWGSLVLEPIMA